MIVNELWGVTVVINEGRPFPSISQVIDNNNNIYNTIVPTSECDII
jgi:hypothetical protein